MFKRTKSMQLARRELNKQKSYEKHIANSIEYKRREVYSYLDKSKNLTENVVKVNSNNTNNHEIAKFIISLDLIKSGKSILTEAIFADGKRADVICIDDMRVYEIIYSEREDSIRHKKESYPLDVTVLYADGIIEQYLQQNVTAHARETSSNKTGEIYGN